MTKALLVKTGPALSPLIYLLTETMLATAFLLGFFGSFHCLGMCGPIALAMQRPKQSQSQLLADGLLYHLGRMGAYALIGLMAGLLGAFFFSSFQSYLAYFSGGMMIVLGLFAVNLDALLLKVPAFQKFYQKLSLLLGRSLQQKKGVLLIGFLNGFLPCGLVYMALFGALATGNLWQGAVYMSLFGLGTMPLMLLSSIAGQLIQLRWRNLMRKAYPILFIILGVLFITRGANLAQSQGRDAETAVFCH